MSATVLSRLRGRAQALSASHFIRNVAAVATGIAAAQAISLAFSPFLTRLYGPESFGALATFTAVVNIITPLATLGYSNAIVMPETEEGATAVARLSLICAAVVAPTVLVFVHMFKAPLAAWTGLGAAPGFLYLIPASLLLGALLSVADQTAIREGLFKAKAGSHVASNLVMNCGKLTGGLLAPSGLLLIMFSMIGRALNFTMLLARVPRKGAFEVRRWFGTAGVREAAIRQRDFALFRMPQSIINSASLGLPVIVLTSLFGAAAAGQYSITTLVLGAPVMLLGQSMAEVFFPRITQAVRANPTSAAALLKRATIFMALLAVIPFGLVAISGDMIFPFVFGNEWQRAGEFSQWIALWMASVLMTRPAVAAMPALRMQGILLVYEGVITTARVGSLFLGARYGDDLLSVALFALVNVSGYTILLLLVLARTGSFRWRGR